MSTPTDRPLIARLPLAVALLALTLLACVSVLMRRREEPPPVAGGEVTLSPTVPSLEGGAGHGAAAPERLVPRVHARFPHDGEAFTQGLVVAGGRTFESTGLVGRSSLREVDFTTGRVLRRIDVPAPYFAEGLALVGDELIQLTWQDRVAFVYGRDDFVKRRELSYDTEGWGLCHDGRAVVMSDGSERLFFRDPATFAVLRTVRVTNQGQPVRMLNELECVGDHVYANVWQTLQIVRVRAADGVVDGVIDATALEPTDARDVLNGIAALPGTDHFLVTGKLWPTVYEVSFEAAP